VKHTFLSKTIGMLGLLSTLSVIVSTGIQQTVQAQIPASLSIADIVAQSGGEYDDNTQDFDILLNALKENNLVDAVAAEDASLTVFAPTDEAFLKFSRFFGYTGNEESAVLDSINKRLSVFNQENLADGGTDPNQYNLRDVLLYHVSNGAITSADLQNSPEGKAITTLYPSEPIPLTYFNGRLVDAAPNLFSARLVSKLTDIQASNGIVHGIDRVLFPTYISSTAPEPASLTSAAGAPMTIADIIAQGGKLDDNNDQDFDILALLLRDTEMMDLLADPDANLTFFAPNDAAFMNTSLYDQAPIERKDGYTSPEWSAHARFMNEINMVENSLRLSKNLGLTRDNTITAQDELTLLQEVLKYHLSQGAKTAAEVQASPSISTLLEGNSITPKDGDLVDESSSFVDPQLQTNKADIQASNGTIHAIDSFLLPRFVQDARNEENRLLREQGF
jgi:serralysin